mmetsp:Transcript_3524/g.4899  ORF Transcript_3524/g.4899 Transcript_3524/m.4899 type:complete len:388 (-) Transcript_3524:367-1530(-)|eukprot:CAMPEP_0184865494 /NCGR_PEP_ID=MMETSP0580-20130426/18325_1 /TAXON_ID=1118495 /ORGANISM="Dactyliosolen fragilissimus" /LENGTH=387 /DNA_ID=CAMNT_0027364725 /DNA_START=130 /DNA_END=1293 /DNA_ORIENTATION=-
MSEGHDHVSPQSPPFDLDQSKIPPSADDDVTELTENDNYYHNNNHPSDGLSIDQNSVFSAPIYKDCTETVHQMHDLLLHLLSTPEEFQSAISFYQSKYNTSTLTDFHAEYDRGTDVGSILNNGADDEKVPTPFLVFAPDAEVVLPQAHTASQLFGYERDGGIELEAASGIVALSQLFLRWLALMPGGDHMNIIDPPGITVMRISGGRYRVTAAHRVIWTWNNEFLNDSNAPSPHSNLHFGDLVSMTIVDVFETDCDGKLLSYCPTFDNRAIKKTDFTVERLRKGSSKIKNKINIVANSRAAAKVNMAASLLGRIGVKAATTVKDTVQKKLEEDRRRKGASEQKANPDLSRNTSSLSFGQTLKKDIPEDKEQYYSDEETNITDERQSR